MFFGRKGPVPFVGVMCFSGTFSSSALREYILRERGAKHDELCAMVNSIESEI